MIKTTLSSFALLLSTTAFAQEAPVPDAAADSQATSVVVTATRAPTSPDRVTASVTVLDKAAIDRAQDIGVTELLLRTPGISMSRNGGYGSATSVRIRGAEPSHTVVVIDGVKLNDPSSTDGSYNFGNLVVGDVSRIEVLRGPQSVLWGSQAIGGVVNIVTPLPTESLEGSFDLEGGSRDTVNARAAAGGRSGPAAWRIGGTYFDTDGISALTRAFGGGERDGYRNKTVSGRLNVDLAENVSADLRGNYSDGRAEFDGFAGDDPEYGTTREFVGYAGLNVGLLSNRLRNRIAYGYTDTDRDNYDPRNQRTRTFDSIGRNKRFEYQGSFVIAEGWDATFGAERETSTFRSVSPPPSLATPVPVPSRGRARLTGFYGQVSGTVAPGLTLTGGVRHDDHSDYGGKALFQGGAVWALETGTTLRASYGEGFKAPALYQLFSEYGNTALGPEQAKGWEAGVTQKLADDKVELGATWFDRRTRGLVIFNSCSFPTSTDPLCVNPDTGLARFGYYQNVARAAAHGLELSAALHPIEGLVLDGNYSWTVSEDRSPGVATDGKWLPRRPRGEANASVSYDWALGLTMGAAVRVAGHSFDDATNTQRLDGYTLVDLRGEYKLSEALTLFARVENLFDKDYMTAYRFGTLGRSIYAGIRGRF